MKEKGSGLLECDVLLVSPANKLRALSDLIENCCEDFAFKDNSGILGFSELLDDIADEIMDIAYKINDKIKELIGKDGDK